LRNVLQPRRCSTMNCSCPRIRRTWICRYRLRTRRTSKLQSLTPFRRRRLSLLQKHRNVNPRLLHPHPLNPTRHPNLLWHQYHIHYHHPRSLRPLSNKSSQSARLPPSLERESEPEIEPKVEMERPAAAAAPQKVKLLLQAWKMKSHEEASREAGTAASWEDTGTS